jgi:CxxC motif-containing protein (DUF1111 family)
MKNIKILVLLSMSLFLPSVFGKGWSQSYVQPKSTEVQPAEALTGFDDKTNGFVTQAIFNEALGKFNKHYIDREGLGPVFNLETCLRCHQFPTFGGSGLIKITRVGKFDGTIFTAPEGGTIIHDVAIPPSIVERLLPEFNVVSKRLPTSLLGDGFVEAIDDETLRALAVEQAKKTNGRIAGQAQEVPILESPNTKRVGRFGWKNSHASLLSFTGEALRNEIGITNPLYPTENTANGKSVAAYDKVPDPEVPLERLETITNFVRATKAPPRMAKLAETQEARAGEVVFQTVGCTICHVQTLKTMPVGSVTNGGRLKINEALGNKIIHPFSDFLLHDVGTGDGIVESGFASTRNKIRTAPLWGLGARAQRLGEDMVYMHDGLSKDLEAAILRHAVEATQVIDEYRKLSSEKQRQLIAFLRSL